MEFLTALLLGLTYSPHCAGMCGPIVLTFPLTTENFLKKISAIIFYNIGKTSTYALLGLVFGIFGRGIQLGGIQQIVSIILGIIVIIVALFPVLSGKMQIISHFFKKITDNLTRVFVRNLGSANTFSFLIVGFLNGILPCGLVYVALAASMLQHSLTNSILYMVFFGLGTIPVLSVIIFFKTGLQFMFRKKLRKIIPWITVIIGILFILRGLNLGIKYISPKAEMLEPVKKIENEPPPCCK